MKPVWLVPVGDAEQSMIDAVRLGVVKQLSAACRDSRQPLDPSFAFHPERGQHHSTLIVERLAQLHTGDDLVVGITALDLFVPILTFVFGEAQLGGQCAVVSYHRLMQPFYGLPDDPRLTKERLVKETVHEIGHTLGLTHCDDYDCVMAASHSVEWLDLKGGSFCGTCRAAVMNSSTPLR